MAARALVQPALVTAGAALSIVSVVGMAAGWGESRTTQSPAGDSRPSTHGQRPDPDEFLNQLGKATRTGDVAFLVGHLNPAVTGRYGRRACAAHVRSLGPVSFDPTRVHRPAPYTWTSDGLTTIVPDTVAVDVAYTTGGRTTDAVVHITEVAGEFTWFTDCGTPRG